MDSRVILILLLIASFAHSIYSQSDTFVLKPNWEIGLQAEYRLEMVLTQGDGTGPDYRKFFHRPVGVLVKDTTDNYYMVEFNLGEVQKEEFLEGMPDQQPRHNLDFSEMYGPPDIWDIDHVVIRINREGKYRGVENKEDVSRQFLKHQNLYLFYRTGDSSRLETDSFEISFNDRIQAHHLGRYLHILFFDPLGRMAGDDYSSTIFRSFPLSGTAMSLLQDYDYNTTINEGSPDTLVYRASLMGKNKPMERLMNMPLDSMIPSFGKSDTLSENSDLADEILSRRTFSTIFRHTINMRMEDLLPCKITLDYSARMTIGYGESYYDKQVTIEKVD